MPLNVELVKVNQILCHISNTPLELIDYCQENDIAVEAYSLIAHGEILNQPEIKKIENYGESGDFRCTVENCRGKEYFHEIST